MIAVVIPAHDEADEISACLRAVAQAALDPRLQGEAVETLVVLDDCHDATGWLAVQQDGVRTLAVGFHNVGQARAAGAELMLERGARWLAFTDADTRVGPGWLAEQLALRCDAVCGSVAVDDWSAYGAAAALLCERFHATYHDVDGHSHIHGANLGVSAEAYRRCGGFAPLACSEDVALVHALQSSGAQIVWSAAPRVWTSARSQARAQGGFSDALRKLLAASTLALPDPAAPR